LSNHFGIWLVGLIVLHFLSFLFFSSLSSLSFLLQPLKSCRNTVQGVKVITDELGNKRIELDFLEKGGEIGNDLLARPASFPE